MRCSSHILNLCWLQIVTSPAYDLPSIHSVFCDAMQVSAAGYDRQAVAGSANNLASKIRSNLTNSLKALGVDILTGMGRILVSNRCYHVEAIWTKIFAQEPDILNTQKTKKLNS